jgi:hypothetical protein
MMDLILGNGWEKLVKDGKGMGGGQREREIDLYHNRFKNGL